MSAAEMRGFTLIEVVIAFAILALSLAALYGAFESALSRSRRDARFGEATLIAQSLLARGGSEFPSAQGNYRGQWNSSTYELTQETVSHAARPSAFTQPTVRVTARVWWTGNTGSRDIEISTLKLVSKAAQ
jgi:general secretion pathway protein I